MGNRKVSRLYPSRARHDKISWTAEGYFQAAAQVLRWAVLVEYSKKPFCEGPIMPLFRNIAWRKRFIQGTAMLVLVVLFSPPSVGETCRPTKVINPFVSAEELAKVRNIEISGQPVIVLNPYVEQPKTLPDEIFPYRRILPLRPDIIFPAKFREDTLIF